MSPSRFLMLQELRGASQGLSLVVLAERLGWSLGQTRKQIERCRRAGLVQPVGSGYDLTPRGYDRLDYFDRLGEAK